MNRILTFAVLCIATSSLNAQTIVGKWQLTKQSSCLEEHLSAETETEEELLDEMKSMGGATAQILQFKDNQTAEESTKIVNKRKNYNSRALLYKHAEGALHILDKKSRTIIESFVVERLSADSLIISNASRACETKVFIRIK